MFTAHMRLRSFYDMHKDNYLISKNYKFDTKSDPKLLEQYTGGVVRKYLETGGGQPELLNPETIKSIFGAYDKIARNRAPGLPKRPAAE